MSNDEFWCQKAQETRSKTHGNGWSRLGNRRQRRKDGSTVISSAWMLRSPGKSPRNWSLDTALAWDFGRDALGPRNWYRHLLPDLMPWGTARAQHLSGTTAMRVSKLLAHRTARNSHHRDSRHRFCFSHLHLVNICSWNLLIQKWTLHLINWFFWRWSI